MNNVSPLISTLVVVCFYFANIPFSFCGITCPNDAIVECTVDPYDFELLGEASWDFAGPNEPIIYKDVYRDYIDGCNEGTIERYWIMPTTEDTCLQLLTFQISTPFSESNITWPQDITLECWDGDVDQPNYWVPNPCEGVGINVQVDTLFSSSSSACALLKFKYDIFNWCTDTHYLHTQKVHIVDEYKPELSIQDSTYAITNSCSRTIELEAIAFDTIGNCTSEKIYWEVYVDLWGDWTDDYVFSSYVPKQDPNFGTPENELYIAPTMNGDVLQFEIPSSIENSPYAHRLVYKASDGCSNVTSHEQVFYVTDKKAPTPYCLATISSVLMENNGTVEIWASDYNVESVDNCTAMEYLRYTFSEVSPANDIDYSEETKSSSLTLTCDDITTSDSVTLEIYVWDEYGNKDFCLTTIRLSDNSGICDGDPALDLEGFIKNEMGEPLTDVTFEVMNSPEGFTMTNDSLGWYDYFSFGHVSLDLNLRRQENALQFVSTIDIVMAQMHILGLIELSEIQKMTADVNCDGSISANDLGTIRRLILGNITDFEECVNWRFLLEETNDYMQEIGTNVFQIQNFSGSLRQDFTGHKMGDVNQSSLTEATQTDPRSNYNFTYSNVSLKKGVPYTIHFYGSEAINVTGFQLALASQDASFVAFANEEVGFTSVQKDLYKISYTSDQVIEKVNAATPLFSVQIIPNKKGKVSDFIRLTMDLSPEMYDDQLLISPISLQPKDDQVNSISDIYPNPSSNQFLFDIVCDKAQQMQVEIMSVATGQLVETYSTKIEQGRSTISLGKQNPKPGIYLYRISMGDYIKAGKIVRL